MKYQISVIKNRHSDRSSVYAIDEMGAFILKKEFEGFPRVAIEIPSVEAKRFIRDLERQYAIFELRVFFG